MSDLKGRALLLSGRAVFLSRKPGWSDKLQDEIEEALRTVQRETAEVIINEIVPEVRENWCGKLPDRQLADAIKARFGLDKEGE